MVPMRLPLALTALLAAVLVTACGSRPAATETSASAEVAPKDAAVWVLLDTDAGSAQWKQLTALIERIPGAEQALSSILADEGLDWKRDVLPALGPEVVVTVPGGASQAVVLTQPEDAAKLAALVEKSGAAATAEVGGWTAVGESRAALDAYLEALDDGTLADDADFQDAVAGLPEEAVARAYVDGSGLGGFAGRAAQAGAGIAGAGGLPAAAGATAGLGRLALALSAEPDGLRLTGNAELDGAAPASFAPTLLDRVPADALAAVVFRGGDLVGSQLDSLGGSSPELRAQLETGLGISLDDVAELFAGQGVLYVRSGAPIPELTLALEGAGARGQQVLGKLVQGLGGLAAAFGGTSGGLKPVTAVEDGVEVTRLALGPVAISWASVGGTLVVTTGEGGIRAFRGDGPKLPGSAGFRRAAADVTLGERTSGFAYADVAGLAALLERVGDEKSSDGLVAALGALDTLAVDTTAESGALRLDGFLRVR
jgi:hypothetical protein